MQFENPLKIQIVDVYEKKDTLCLTAIDFNAALLAQHAKIVLNV